ncbi:DUF885 domain-containing protein [Blastococcus sp. MG754426]|uniref:DUF885 family protein n=1 Tax=unclassified Blastococcus TaxID=2619396 RepID=UPI001EF00E67|nr:MULTISPECIES: DUF885 family protein [unclassified Blastococcus]MCF6506813.1 DUF885 domain-containing protein [Blastococcus sp. MG754426]MCF6511613.1 DUF885 domain-containing protein [Blastococcus sp. MG754427]
MTAETAVRDLGAEIWEWRLATALRTSDDIPRVDHPAGWLPQFSAAAVEEKRRRAAEFRARWEGLDVSSAPVPVQVDHRLLGSALARVTWDLDVLRNWERDAVLLVGQVLGPYFDLLLRPPPFDAATRGSLQAVLDAVPAQVAVARENLARAGAGPLARAAARLLGDIEEALPTSVAGLREHLDAGQFDALARAAGTAVRSLVELREWLWSAAPGMTTTVGVGREAFVWFLRHVALTPAEPEALVAAAQQEYDRAVVWETLERNRNREVPLPALPVTAEEQVARQARDARQVRDFYEREGLLSQPPTLRDYLTAPLPAYLRPIQWLGVTDDLTFEGRLHEDGVSYTPDPGPALPYFYAANARDPRLGIVHEGAHYQQLALSWAHPDPLRRRYYDSIPNEGIAFYNEELMLQAGLFDDAPHSRQVVHNFNRLRALRVIVDVNLATGAWGVDEAVAAFVDRVPMDEETAFEETASYAANPGHAMTYLVGKREILRMLADAVARLGDSFSLRAFHDHVWLNGNVPFSLQRWELLGDRSDVDALDAAGRW